MNESVKVMSADRANQYHIVKFVWIRPPDNCKQAAMEVDGDVKPDILDFNLSAVSRAFELALDLDLDDKCQSPTDITARQ